MLIHKKARRSVMEVLNEDAKARLYCDYNRGRDQVANGYESSSFSKHEELWSTLIHGFFLHGEEDSGSTSLAAAAAVSDEDEKSVDQCDGGAHYRYERAAKKISQLLQSSRKGNPFCRRLLSDITRVADELVSLSNPSEYRRGVMAWLRERGYNAGICKVKWGNSGKLIAGSYEYIDVVVGAGTSKDVEEYRRYIIDLAFNTQFVVARASAEYERAVAGALPAVLVAEPEQLRQVVRVAAKAARASLKSCGLHVPPWRKERYMIAKWFGPRCRKTSELTVVAAGGGSSTRSETPCFRTFGFAAAAPAGE